MVPCKTSLLTSVKQIQRLSFNTEIQQSLHALQLPIMELGEWVKEEIENNPLLEFETKQESSRHAFALENQENPPISLFEHLMKQAKETFSHEEEILLAEQIIGNLNEKGFLTTPLSEFSHNLSWAEQVLQEIQGFDPPGIAALNVQHCFLLQLERQGKMQSLAYTMIEEHYDDLLHNRLHLLATKLHSSLKKIKEVIQKEVKGLNLHPGYSFRNEIAPSVHPDILLKKEGEHFHIEISESFLPTFSIAAYEEQENPELEPYYHAARWLMHILAKRKQTLLTITQFLVQQQTPFFSEKTKIPSPMTLKQVAEATELHESTVSRAIADKYLFCSQGVLRLRDLFTSSRITERGEEISHPQLKEKLCQLIAKEDKKAPYSDESLSLQLKKMGLPCARRTIAKYRNALNIPHASLRRHW